MSGARWFQVIGENYDAMHEATSAAEACAIAAVRGAGGSGTYEARILLADVVAVHRITLTVDWPKDPRDMHHVSLPGYVAKVEP